MTIDSINSLPQAEFVDALGWIYEHSPWVAERAWMRRPFDSTNALHAAMCGEVEAASREEQLALLCAHPDLGSRLPLSTASQSEQAGAGFSAGDEVSLDMIRELNTRYREKFGFPFIYAVKGSPQHDIFFALDIRLNNTPEEEFHEALYQVHRIAYFRLDGLLNGTPSGS